MKLLDLTLGTPEENLAVDEALLEEAEAGRLTDEVLRLWESPRPVVVIGRSSRAALEVDLSYCAGEGIPVLRRCSGGAAVVIGPGCLMYSVVLAYRHRSQLRMVDAAHRYVLSTVAAAIGRFQPASRIQGISDLAMGGRKFSGNSLRCKRDHLLYHGTLLCNASIELIGRCLRTPPRQPDYRAHRSHIEFLANLCVPAKDLRAELVRQWEANQALDAWPEQETRRLCAERYQSDAWNLRY